MGSSRLPGKVMKDLGGKPAIFQVVDRVLRSKLIDHVVVATTDKPVDDELAAAFEGYLEKVSIFRGDEDDVLDRYYKAATEAKANIIVRVTGDCPLHDAEVIDRTIQLYLDSDIDYASNSLELTYPDGLDTEVFSYEALKEAWEKADMTSEREHVTPYIHKNPHLFKQGNDKYHRNISHMRWTVDTQEDYELAKKVYEKLGPGYFGMEQIVELFESDPDLLKVNDMYERNEGYAKSLKEDKKIT